MKDFTNEKVSKEYNKKKTMCLVGILSIILANVAFAWYALQKPNNMHDLILNNPKENKMATIEITNISEYFAYYPGNSNQFYFVMDEEGYIYIVRMNSSSYNKLGNQITNEKKAIIEGSTKITPSDIKKIAIEVYNEILSEEEQLTIDDFDDYFGTLYLDIESSALGINEVVLIVMVFVAMLGFGFGLAGGISVWRFKRKVNKLTPEEREKIDREMNQEGSFYYSNAHAYLTENYIVNFAPTFEAISYNDIIWVYKFEQRRNGIKVSQCIMVMTKNGKSHTIATLNGLTKKAKDVFDEIFNAIAGKSTNAVIGYTSENRKLAKSKIEK